jgi:hypothetical protein
MTAFNISALGYKHGEVGVHGGCKNWKGNNAQVYEGQMGENEH